MKRGPELALRRNLTRVCACCAALCVCAQALKQVFDSHLQSLEEAQAVTADGDDERATELTQLADDALEAAMALGKRLSEA